MFGAIHTVQIGHRTAWAPDAEGRDGVTVSYTSVKGRLCEAGGGEVPAGGMGRFGADADAIFLAPLTVAVTENDEIVASGIHPLLDGSYEVKAIHYTPVHQRLELRKPA